MINKKKLLPMIDKRPLEMMIEEERQFSKQRTELAIKSVEKLIQDLGKD